MKAIYIDVNAKKDSTIEKFTSYLESEGYVNVGSIKDLQEFRTAIKESNSVLPTSYSLIIVDGEYRGKEKSFKFCELPFNVVQGLEFDTLKLKTLETFF